MYKICTCPVCKNSFIERISVSGLEKHTFEAEAEALTYVLENVTIKTASLDPKFATDIRNVLKSSIHDEQLYLDVVKRLHSVFEAHI